MAGAAEGGAGLKCARIQLANESAVSYGFGLAINGHEVFEEFIVDCALAILGGVYANY